MDAMNSHFSPEDKETLLKHFDERAAALRAAISEGTEEAWETRVAIADVRNVLKAMKRSMKNPNVK